MQQPAALVSGWALSQTHRHLLAITNTELLRLDPEDGQTIRLLDVGCGDGLLLVYLSKALQACWPGLRFELYGFDVADHGVQAPGFFREALERLERDAPGQDWTNRLSLISEKNPWPYEDNSFDVIVSNQVLEHVRDHRFFFDQMARVLKPTGFAAHIYPTTHCFIEPHLIVPCAQRIKDAVLLNRWLTLWSRLGVANYGAWARRRREQGEPSSVADYAGLHTNFLTLLTNYRTFGQMKDIAKQSRLLPSFCYTAPYYTGKLRSIFGLDGRIKYVRTRSFRSYLASVILRYISSATLVVYK